MNSSGVRTQTFDISITESAGVINFHSANYVVVEGATATVWVTRTGGLAGDVTVDWDAPDGLLFNEAKQADG